LAARGGQVGDERREATVLVLRGLRRLGELDRARVAAAARGLRVAERTVWRWLAESDRGDIGRKPRPRFEVTTSDIEDLAYWNGNVAAFHRALRERDPLAPAVETVWRAFQRALTPGQLAGLAQGEPARRRFDTFLTRTPRSRNDCWEADHVELAIQVVLRDGHVVKPWLTSFIDARSRGLCGWAISEVPSQEGIFAALRAAILIDPPFGPLGGIPRAIRWDRGKDFLATAVGVATDALGIDGRALPGYAPYLKGIVERWHETIETMLLAELPGFTHRPKDRRARPVDESAPLLGLDNFVDLFAEFGIRYNGEHRHTSLRGATPLEVWQRDTKVIVTIPREKLGYLLFARTNRTVTTKGIGLNGQHYNAAELVGRVGEVVEVRHVPHRVESVEIFRGDVHLCTAWPADDMSSGEDRRLVARRARDVRWLARRQQIAADRRRTRFAAITELRGASDRATDKSGDASRKRLTPSRSLDDYTVIPPHMVRPLSQPIQDGDSK